MTARLKVISTQELLGEKAEIRTNNKTALEKKTRSIITTESRDSIPGC
jgi:hypothetical protein